MSVVVAGEFEKKCVRWAVGVLLAGSIVLMPLSGAAAELNTTNNTSAVSIHIGTPAQVGPDLTIEGLFTPQHHHSSPSGAWSFSYGIRNMGKTSASDPSVTRAYLSRDFNLSSDDRLIGEENVPEIPVGVIDMRTMTVTVPSGYSTEYLWLIVKTDADNSVNELNENNNTGAVSLHIGTQSSIGADLIVEDLVSPQHHVDSPSNEWSISYGVTNMGNSVVADAGTVRVFFSLDDELSSNDALITNDSHPQINVGETQRRNTTVSIPGGYAPGYYYLIVAVGDSGVDEAPDLVVINPEVSNESPEIGEPTTVRATVFNQGNATSTRTNLRYFRSLDATISPLDDEVGSDFVTILAPGGSSPESTTVRINTQGTYWLGGCVDPVPYEWNSGNNCSAGIRVTVGGGGGQCAANRSLPGYLQGRPTVVTISVTPPLSTSSWVVNEVTPQGWAITDVSDGGSVNGRNVMYGPFNDGDPRTLTYVATSPAGTSGEHLFDGTAAFDGQSEPICGDTELSELPGAFHPADSDSDWMMEVGEAATYGASWKAGNEWPWPPSPIPIDYVTNAGFLLAGGESYSYEPGTNPPWVPDAGGHIAGTGTAISSLEPSAYVPGESVIVRIAVTPDSNTNNYAVADSPPAGWTVSAISSAGQWDVSNRKVKWGPFLDNESRALNYTVTPPVGESETRVFSGVVSLDGSSADITGDRSIALSGGGGDEDHVYWLDTAAHLPGLFGSQWRTDVVARNLKDGPAAIEFKLHTADGVLGVSTTVDAGDQGVFVDIVGLLEYQGKGCLEVVADGPVQVSGRIYNLADDGTFGQYVEAYTPDEALGAGESGALLQLRQMEGVYRTNISLTNTGAETATVRVSLFDSDATLLHQYNLNPAPGRLIQDPEPFKRRANQPDLGWGFAVVDVLNGAGILASASVVDSRTNDATTIPFKR